MSLHSLTRALGNDAIPGELMSRHTTLGIGGPADLFAEARSLAQLRRLVRMAWQHGVPHTILGGGANVLVADRGIRGLVIRNRACGVSLSPSEGEAWRVQAECGAALRDVSRQCMEQGLAGLEWAVDVPGTVGGAVVGNAGAFGGYIGDSLHSALVFSVTAGERWWPRDELGLTYRSSIFKGEEARAGSQAVLLMAVFVLRPGDKSGILRQAAMYSQRRLETQPTAPSAGSVFKRTEQYPAGFLIENAGLKGVRVGGAMVSPQHANFIVNTGGATATDVRELIQRIGEAVSVKFGINLELEIELLGEQPSR